MAVTQNTYTGNGSTVLYSFTFPYLETTDIKVSVNGTVTTAYTLANATTIQFNTAPANGAAIRIYRETDDSALAATFYPGSAIRSSDLNENFTQNLYVTQESTNNAATATSTANTALTNSNTAISTANTALSTANTASSNASAAVSTANTASSNASAAVSTANTASSNATTAVNTANAATATANSAASDAATALSTANTASSNASAAVATANTASSNASAAVSTANTASSNATTAVNTANNALSTANAAQSTANTADANANAALNAIAGTVQFVLVANVASIPGSPSNGDAIEIADSTGIESFTPLTNRPTGFVGDSGLSVRLQYLSAGSSWNWLNYFPNNAETRYLKFGGGTITGNLEIGNSGSLTFEGSTANAFETTLAVTDPTADRTITLPDQSGNVLVSGNATIVNNDINASAAIAGTKISPDFGSQNVTTTGTSTAASFAPTSSTVPTNGVYLPSANSVAISTNGAGRLFVDASGRVGIGGAPAADLEITSALPSFRLSDNNGTADNNKYQIYINSSQDLQFQAFSDAGSGGGAVWRFTRNTSQIENFIGSRAGTDRITLSNWDNKITFSNALGVFGTATAHDLQITTNNNERLRITSDGGVAIGTSTASNYGLRVSKAPDTATFASIGSVINASPTTTTACYGAQTFIGAAANAGTPYTVPVLQHYRASQGTINADATITNQYGFFVTNTLTGATNNYGFFGDVPSGTGRFNVYIQGTANNYFAGNVGIGTTSPDSKLATVSTRAADVLSLASYFDVNGSAGDKNRFVLGCSSGSVRGIEIIAEKPGSNNAHNIIFSNSRGDSAPQEAARIDSSGRLLVGTSSATANSSLVLEGHSANGLSNSIVYLKRGNTPGAANSFLGVVNFSDVTEGVGAEIRADSEAAWVTTPGSESYPGRLVFSTTADGASSATERLRITNDGVQCYDQAAPVSYAAAATLVVGNLKNGIIQYTGAAATLTLPTGTLTEGGFPGIYTNMTFEWSVINTGSGTCTIGGGTGHTIVGAATVTAGASGRFASRRTAANTFVSYRLS